MQTELEKYCQLNQLLSETNTKCLMETEDLQQQLQR